MTRKSLCQSHPRLFSKLSSESGYGSSSPIGLTGNMQVLYPIIFSCVIPAIFQLSSRYKSSAELVSELLQRPLHINNYQNRYQNNKLNNNSEDNEERKVIKVTQNSKLKSVELVKNIGLNRRKVGRDECKNLSVENKENILCDVKYSDQSDSLDCDSSEGKYSYLLKHK